MIRTGFLEEGALKNEWSIVRWGVWVVVCVLGVAGGRCREGSGD